MRIEPQTSRIVNAAVAAIVFCAALAMYIPTTAPGLWWGDGPELTAAAWCLGVAHQPGYPLYMLTGHVLTHALRGAVEPIRAMTLYSAFLLAAGCAALAIPFARTIRDRMNPARGWVAPVFSGGIALLAAAAYTPWEHATFPEVYPLTFLLTVMLVIAAWPSAGSDPGTRAWLIALVTGIASTNHYSVIALYPLAGLRLIECFRQSSRRWRLAAVAFAAWLAPLLLYLYVPIRAAAHPPLNETDPSTPARFLMYVSTHTYSDFKGWPDDPVRAVARWLAWWGRQWSPETIRPAAAAVIGTIIIAAAALGLAQLARRQAALGWGLLISLAMTLAFSVFYQIDDIDPYFLVALPAALIGLIEAVAPLARRIPAATAACLAAVIVVSIACHHGELDLSRDFAAEGFARRVLDPIEPGGVVLTMGDSCVFPLFYEQIVHRRRPDVAIIPLDWFYASWYRPYLCDGPQSPIPLRIPDRIASDNAQFTCDIINGILIPAHRAGRKVYCIPVRLLPLDDIYSRRPVARLLSPDYRLKRPNAPIVPPPLMQEILPNNAIIAMNTAQIEALVRK